MLCQSRTEVNRANDIVLSACELSGLIYYHVICRERGVPHTAQAGMTGGRRCIDVRAASALDFEAGCSTTHEMTSPVDHPDG